MQRKAFHCGSKSRTCPRYQLMKIRITGIGNSLTHLQLTVTAPQPAGLLADAAKLGKRSMCPPVSYRNKWLGKRAHRDFALWIFPSLRHDPALFIQQNVREIWVSKFARQQRGSGLGMQILCCTWRREGLSNQKHQYGRDCQS